MNKTEAERIAAAVNIIKPDWSAPLLMKVLGDDRMIKRPYADAMLALVACALDPTTEKPGRVHERGNWWAVVGAVSGQQGPTYRAHAPGYCIVCGDNWSLHGERNENGGGHDYENPLDARPGAKPTPEQRAEIDKANAEAKAKATAEREAVEARKVRDMDQVLVSHTSTDDQEDECSTTKA